jgi:hypothetical protein
MTPPLLMVMPLTVLPPVVNVTVHVLVPVPPEELKAVDVVAVPYVVDGFDPPETVMPAFTVTVVVEEVELVWALKLSDV